MDTKVLIDMVHVILTHSHRSLVTGQKIWDWMAKSAGVYLRGPVTGAQYRDITHKHVTETKEFQVRHQRTNGIHPGRAQGHCFRTEKYT